MSFRNIKGQDNAIGFLKRTIQQDRIAHAYIFFGPGGVGKKLTALNFAKALNCVDPSKNGACGECASCKKIDALNHPDILLLELEKEESFIKIDRIREIIKDIGLKPYEGRKKVYIIDNADAMRHDAANALLKTLEEPASESILILITEKLKALLPTVISRAQVLKFYPLAKEELERILMSEYKMDKTSSHVLSCLSSGRLGESLKYKSSSFIDKRSLVINGLMNRTLFNSDLGELSKSDLRLYLDIMLTWYRDIMITKAGFEGTDALVNIDREAAILNEAGRTEFGKLENAIRQIILTNSFLDQSANAKLAMAVLGVKLMDSV